MNSLLRALLEVTNFWHLIPEKEWTEDLIKECENEFRATKHEIEQTDFDIQEKTAYLKGLREHHDILEKRLDMLYLKVQEA